MHVKEWFLVAINIAELALLLRLGLLTRGQEAVQRQTGLMIGRATRDMMDRVRELDALIREVRELREADGRPAEQRPVEQRPVDQGRDADHAD